MTAFEEASYTVAESFLSTVVVVDNMAAYVPEEEPMALEVPDELATIGEDDPIVDDAIAEDADTAASAETTLDAGVLSAAFADLGLVCGILRPQPQDSKKDAVLRASKGADIVVLDWQMDDEGDLATEIIMSMLAADIDAGGRLRLVVVYTGHTLAAVTAKLGASLPDFEQSADGFVFEKGSARVIVLAKGGQPNAVGAAAAGVSEGELPKRLVTEFAKFAGGLLPNATLAAIDGVRRHTHRMLARFSKDLDGPFLTHRTMLLEAEDAEQFATELIMGELDAQVPIDRILAERLGEASVRDYLEQQIDRGMTPNIMLNPAGDNLRALSLDEACALVRNGSNGLPNGVQIGKSKLHERLYRLVDGDLQASKANHLIFAQRAKMKRDAATVGHATPPLPALRLGSVLASRKAFWVCLTPMCDSGRLDPAGDRLLFAELSVSDDKFDFVVPDNSKMVRLVLEKKRTNLASFRFVPGADRTVRVAVDEEQLVVQSVTDSPLGTRATKFRWLGELKPMHAQRCVQAFTSNLARVGVDDFEWHRSQMGSPE